MQIDSDDIVTLDRAYPDVFTRDEAALLAGLKGGEVNLRARTRVIRADEPINSSLYLTRGFLGRFSCDRFGRRQFTGLQIPGDYADLMAYPLGRIEHDIDSLGETAIRRMPHEDLRAVIERNPELGRKLWRVSLIDAAIHRYWIFRVGRLSGKTRIANFLAEMFVRLYVRGLATPDGCALPLSQTDIAEICGITAVHLNRLLGELRLDEVCVVQNGRLEIMDLKKLMRVGEHSRTYLYLSDGQEAALRALTGPF